MATLTIRGHITRGIEVIETLQMLGGANTNLLSGAGRETIYYIKESNICCVCDRDLLPRPHIIFSLEIFQEKFPYKVGDKVISILGETEVLSMEWISDTDKVWYTTSNGSYNAEYLQPYKQTMEERQCKELRMPLDDNDKLATEVTIDGNKILPPNGYLIGKITQGDNGMLVEYVKKLPEYPQTYEVCCMVINNACMTRKGGHKGGLIQAFQKLLVCRDAYWKIAGVQMGLEKPWEPDYDSGVNKYGIICMDGVVQKSTPTTNWERHLNKILDFPIAEMRDTFYNNFKDLIEECKELL